MRSVTMLRWSVAAGTVIQGVLFGLWLRTGDERLVWNTFPELHSGPTGMVNEAGKPIIEGSPVAPMLLLLGGGLGIWLYGAVVYLVLFLASRAAVALRRVGR